MNLKKTLMDLGNKLVLDRHFIPSGPAPVEIREALRTDRTTEPITMFAEWLNMNPEAREILAEMGVQWPMPDGKR
jgi:hypothetical protein